jgi:hypothetical protein
MSLEPERAGELPMFAKSYDEITQIYGALERIKRLSDGLLKIGPINVIGIDGLLALVPIPGLGTVYSVVAGLIILFQGLRARVSPVTWFTALIILLVDSGIATADSIAKFAGPFVYLIPGGADALFQGHLYAAHIIQKDIARTHYVDGSASEARKSGTHQAHRSSVKATKGKSRLVYLRG